MKNYLDVLIYKNIKNIKLSSQIPSHYTLHLIVGLTLCQQQRMQATLARHQYAIIASKMQIDLPSGMQFSASEAGNTSQLSYTDRSKYIHTLANSLIAELS